MHKKTIMFLTLIAVFLTCFSFLVFAGKEEIIAKANNAGIDTDELTAEQVIAKVNERDKELSITNPEALKPAPSDEAAVTADNPDGLTPELIAKREKVLLLDRARAYGIDTTGLTDEQINQKIEAKAKELEATDKNEDLTLEQIEKREHVWLLDSAGAYGIDTTGLTDEQIIEKIMVELKAIESKNNSENITPELKEKRAKVLLMDRARMYGIDTTGLTDEQIKEKVEAKIDESLLGQSVDLTPELRAYQEKYILLDLATQYGIDISGLTNEQAKEKIKATIDELLSY